MLLLNSKREPIEWANVRDQLLFHKEDILKLQ